MLRGNALPVRSLRASSPDSSIADGFAPAPCSDFPVSVPPSPKASLTTVYPRSGENPLEYRFRTMKLSFGARIALTHFIMS